MGERGVAAPFLTKTYKMVDDESTNEVISWGEKGTSFIVWKTAEFAKDLLPNYFKHNNFSSFVRQLNTYGFRKLVPDKWEFANDNFRRGQKELLAEIRRRKNTTPPIDIAGKPSHVSSGEDAGSLSTSSPGSKNPGSSTIEIADLSGENEKLRRDNEILSSELAQTRKQCDELMTILTKYSKVGPDQIYKIIKQGTGIGISECGTYKDEVGGDGDDDDGYIKDDDEKEDKDSYSRMKKEEDNNGLKLFGVWLKDGKKRGRCCDGECNMSLCGTQPHHVVKAMKTR